jgi:hypothetical protein
MAVAGADSGIKESQPRAAVPHALSKDKLCAKMEMLEAIEFAARVRQTVRDELEKCGIKTDTHS